VLIGAMFGCLNLADLRWHLFAWLHLWAVTWQQLKCNVLFRSPPQLPLCLQLRAVNNICIYACVRLIKLTESSDAVHGTHIRTFMCCANAIFAFSESDCNRCACPHEVWTATNNVAHIVSQNVLLYFCSLLCPVLTDFQSSFTARLITKFVVESTFKIPPHYIHVDSQFCKLYDAVVSQSLCRPVEVV